MRNLRNTLLALSLFCLAILGPTPALADKPSILKYSHPLNLRGAPFDSIQEAFEDFIPRRLGDANCGGQAITSTTDVDDWWVKVCYKYRAKTYDSTLGQFTCPGRFTQDCANLFVHFSKIPVLPVEQSKDVCPKRGNPISPLSASKTESIFIDAGLSTPMTIGYDTSRKLPGNAPAFDTRGTPSFGDLWEGSWHRRLAFYQSVSSVIHASRGATRWATFVSGKPDTETTDRFLWSIGGISGPFYVDTRTRAIETYSAEGVLKEVKYADGRILRFTYSDTSTPTAIAPVPGLLIKVSDERQREVQFAYSRTADETPRITSMTSPGNRVTSFSYDTAARLEKITWPDLTTRQLKYERADVPWALTGQVNEQGIRSGTYGYDNEGRAISTERAVGVDRYSVAYTSPPRWEVTDIRDSSGLFYRRERRMIPPVGTQMTDPNGAVISMDPTSVLGSPRLNRQSQPAGSGCGPASSLQEYDANANVAVRDDFTGQRSCYGHNMTRNLETTRVEGLANTQSCGTVMPTGSALPAGTRKITTDWHPDWPVATKVAEPRRLTTHIYNGQVDPFAGYATASCAPASAKLQDGKPIAVLCKTVEQATYDASGGAGFGAALDTSVPNRVWNYTYNEFGQVLTSRDPRGNTTTNSYYTTTTADYTRGDLEKTTNALNQTTRFTKYNPMGQVLQSIDANNVVTDYQYDLRGRLKTQTTAGQSTVFAYTLTGQLERVTQPDSSYIGYEYDPADRLVAVKDNLGNRIEYTLDNAGQRREERVKDPAGTLKGQVNRIFDVLGRAQQVTGRE
jgi:YD repeat-containing protein